jgi:hypothetical protein
MDNSRRLTASGGKPRTSRRLLAAGYFAEVTFPRLFSRWAACSEKVVLG